VFTQLAAWAGPRTRGPLRRHGVTVSLGTFVRVGVYVTMPGLVASLATLWLVTL
jgi:Na+/H+ antiporter NhaD/arsenite permease-like protein